MSTIDRRRFNAMVGAVSLTQARSLFAAMTGKDTPAPEILRLSRNGWMPNNPDLPVLIYRAGAEGPAEQLASQMEAEFRQNGWPRSGEMVCMTFIITIRRPTRFSGLPAVTLA